MKLWARIGCGWRSSRWRAVSSFLRLGLSGDSHSLSFAFAFGQLGSCAPVVTLSRPCRLLLSCQLIYARLDSHFDGEKVVTCQVGCCGLCLPAKDRHGLISKTLSDELNIPRSWSITFSPCLFPTRHLENGASACSETTPWPRATAQEPP